MPFIKLAMGICAPVTLGLSPRGSGKEGEEFLVSNFQRAGRREWRVLRK
jgi:hypothetical protein